MLILVIGILSSDLQIQPAAGSNLNFGQVQNLSQDSFTSGAPASFAVGNNVYLAWQNSTTTANNDILFRASTDNGTSFGTTKNLSKTLLRGDSGQQQVAGTGIYVYVAWQDNTTGTYTIWFSASNNTGQNFNFVPPFNMATLGCGGGCNNARAAANPRIAASGSNVYIVWQEDTNNQGSQIDVFYALSTNNGKTFSVIDLSKTNAGSNPVPAVAGTNVYVAWLDSSAGDNVFLKASTNSGASFGNTLNLSNLASGSGSSASLERIAAVGSNVYVAWTRVTIPGIPKDTFFTFSTNSGSSFSTPVNLSQNSASVSPALAAVGSNVYVAWANVTGTRYVVSLRTSTNNGANFNPVVYLSDNTGDSETPQLAAAGSNVYLAWQDRNSNNNVFFISSSDSGATFGNMVNFSGDTNSQLIIPTLAAAGTNAYVAWQDDSPGIAVGGADDILFRGTVPTSAVPDVAITAISPSRSFAYSGVTGNPVIVSVTASNPGTVSASFTVSVKANGTFIAANQTVSNLAPGTNTILQFGWNTGSLNPSVKLPWKYILTAYASQVSPPGETNLSNNSLTWSGTFTVKLKGDVSGDCRVNIVDLSAVGAAFGTTPPANINADINNDGTVNIIDLSSVGSAFGQTC